MEHVVETFYFSPKHISNTVRLLFADGAILHIEEFVFAVRGRKDLVQVVAVSICDQYLTVAIS